MPMSCDLRTAIERQTDNGTITKKNRQKDKGTKQANGQTDKRTNRQTDKRTNRKTDKRTTEKQTNICSFRRVGV